MRAGNRGDTSTSPCARCRAFPRGTRRRLRRDLAVAARPRVAGSRAPKGERRRPTAPREGLRGDGLAAKPPEGCEGGPHARGVVGDRGARRSLERPLSTARRVLVSFTTAVDTRAEGDAQLHEHDAGLRSGHRSRRTRGPVAPLQLGAGYSRAAALWIARGPSIRGRSRTQTCTGPVSGSSAASRSRRARVAGACGRRHRRARSRVARAASSPYPGGAGEAHVERTSKAGGSRIGARRQSVAPHIHIVALEQLISSPR